MTIMQLSYWIDTAITEVENDVSHEIDENEDPNPNFSNRSYKFKSTGAMSFGLIC